VRSTIVPGGRVARGYLHGRWAERMPSFDISCHCDCADGMNVALTP